MLASEAIKVSINRSYAEVYDFLSDPMNLGRWATNPDSVMEALGGGDWIVDVPRGRMVIRLTPRNSFGVLDYQVFPLGADGGPVTPVRLVPNGDGCELLLLWMQREGVTDDRFASDAEWVASDLQRLKVLLEGG